MKFSMIFSAIDRSSKVIGKIMRNTERLKSTAVGATKASAKAVGATAKGVAVAGGLMTAALTGSANAAMDFESSMADVNKVVEFQSPAQFEQFSEDILTLSTRIPLAASGLAEISAEAGAAGIALEDNLRFTEFTAKSAVAFDMAAGHAGDSFAKIRNVYSLSQTGVEGMADAVNHLSNSMASKAPEIVDFINRAGGAAPMLKASATEMAAIGSAMIATGTAPEVAARGLTALSTNLEVGGSKVEKALQSVGLTHEELMARIAANPGDGLIHLFEALDQSPRGTEALKQLVGQDFVDDFSKITARSDLLAKSLSLVGGEAAYAGSVQAEFATRAATTANSVDLLKNNLTAVAVEVGNQALPVVNTGLQNVIGFLQSARSETSRLQTVFSAITALWADFFEAVGSWGETIADSLDGVGGAFTSLGDTIGQIFSLFSGGSDDAVSIGHVIGNVLAGGFELLLTALEKIAIGLKFIIDKAKVLARPIADLFRSGKAAEYANTVKEVVTGAFRALGRAVSKIGEILAAFWTAVTTAIGPWVSTISDSFTRVKAAFSDLGDTISRIFALFSDSDGASNFGHVVGTVLAGAFNLLLIAIEGVVWAIDYLLTGVENFIKWFQGKEVDWSVLIPSFDSPAIQGAVDVVIGIVETGWDVLSVIFDNIIDGASKLGKAVGSALELAVKGAEAAFDALSGSTGVDRIFDELGTLAERGYGADFVQGQALTEALSAGEVSVESYRKALEAVVQEGGTFAQTAGDMLAASRQLDDFKMPEPPTPKLPDTQEIDRTMAKLSDIEAAAKRVPQVVRGAMETVDSILSNLDFTDHGVALMRTLADGVRAGTHLVVDAIGTATLAVPSSAARSVLPDASQARSASSASSIAQTGGGSSGGEGRNINFTYGDFHFDSASPENLASFRDEMAKHRREVKRMIDEEKRREERKGF